MHKFRNTTMDGTDAANSTKTDLQLNWPPYLSIASMIPNVLFLKLAFLAPTKHQIVIVWMVFIATRVPVYRVKQTFTVQMSL